MEFTFHNSYVILRLVLSSVTAGQSRYLIRNRNCLPFASTCVHLGCLVESVLLIVLGFCVVAFCFCFFVVCLFLFLFFVFVYFLFIFCLRLVSCAPGGASVSGLSIPDCPFVFSDVYLLYQRVFKERETIQ